jgi:type I restriction enzyme S subunit
MDRLRFKDELGNNYPSVKIETLGKISKITKGKQLNKIDMISEGHFYVLNGGIEPSGYTDRWNTPKNTITISEGGNSCGYVNFNKENFWSGGHNYSLLNPKINSNFLYSFLKYKQNEIMRLRVGSGLPNIQISSLAKFEIKVPCGKEQEKIGGFLSSFDKLIQKQKEKIGLLKELKKGYLQQMFPNKGSNIPKIRFKGFADSWEQCKFKDVFVKLQNNSLSRADLNGENGYAMNVHYGDVLIKFSEILDVKNENIPYISEPTIIGKYKNSFLQNGDIIIADAAEDNTVGKCCEIAGLSQETVLSGLHTIPCRPLKKFASGYLGYYMNSNVYHDQLLPLIQGSKISSISINTLANTSLVYPKSIDEQILIANKFRAIDKLITLHQHKLEGLVKIKKGYIQRLFA